MQKQVENIAWSHSKLNQQEAKEIMHHFIEKSCREFELPHPPYVYLDLYSYDKEYFEEILGRIEAVFDECREDYTRPENDELDKQDYCFRYLQAEVMFNHLQEDVTDILISDLVELTFSLSDKVPNNDSPITYSAGLTPLNLYYFDSWRERTTGKTLHYKIPALISAEYDLAVKDNWKTLNNVLSENLK